MEWVLIGALSLAVLVALIMTIAYKGQGAEFKAFKQTHAPIMSLLGPPEQTTDHDNDMLMLLVRDLLVNRFNTFSLDHKYFPPPSVVDRMRMVAGYLKPYRQQLKQLGWHYVGDFIDGTILRTGDDGRAYITRNGSHNSYAVVVLAETAQVLMNFPFADTIEADIQKDINVMESNQ